MWDRGKFHQLKSSYNVVISTVNDFCNKWDPTTKTLMDE